MDMIIVWALSWWYGAGWKACLRGLRERLVSSYDYFSIGLLAKTLFAPFRQISAGKVRGPIGLQWRAFVDRLISRFIGAFVRLILIVVGSGPVPGTAVGGGPFVEAAARSDDRHVDRRRLPGRRQWAFFAAVFRFAPTARARAGDLVNPSPVACASNDSAGVRTNPAHPDRPLSGDESGATNLECGVQSRE